MKQYRFMRKKELVLIALIFILLIFCTINKFFSTQQRINSFVHNHKIELDEIANAYLNGDTSINNYKGVKVDQLYPGKNDIVQFDYKGTGLVPFTKYYGFYYSKEDVPAAFQNVDMKLTAVSSKEWTWTDGTDNGGRTVKIMKHWFYYEAWF